MLSVLTEWWFWPIVIVFGTAAVGAIGVLLIAIIALPIQAGSALVKAVWKPKPALLFTLASEVELRESLAQRAAKRCRLHEPLLVGAKYSKWDRNWWYTLVCVACGRVTGYWGESGDVAGDFLSDRGWRRPKESEIREVIASRGIQW